MLLTTNLFQLLAFKRSKDLLAALELGYLIPRTKYFTNTVLPQTYESFKIKI